MPDNSAKIAHLESILDSGAIEAVIDGQKVRVDPAAIRKRLRELEATDDNITVKRPRASTLDLRSL